MGNLVVTIAWVTTEKDEIIKKRLDEIAKKNHLSVETDPNYLEYYEGKTMHGADISGLWLVWISNSVSNENAELYRHEALLFLSDAGVKGIQSSIQFLPM